MMKYVLNYQNLSALGILAVFVAAFLLCKKSKQPWQIIMPCMMVSLVGLLIGAKFFGIISYASYLLRQGKPLVDLFNSSGIVFYGGLLGYYASLAFLLPRYLNKTKPAWAIVAVTTPLFHGFARIGCYLAGCCYGVESQCGVFAAFHEHRIPVQLIESAFNFILFGVLLFIFLNPVVPRLKKARRHLTAIYLVSYSAFRFTIEFWRGDAVRGGLGPFSFSQLVAMGILIGVGVYFVLLYWKRRARNMPTA